MELTIIVHHSSNGAEFFMVQVEEGDREDTVFVEGPKDMAHPRVYAQALHTYYENKQDKEYFEYLLDKDEEPDYEPDVTEAYRDQARRRSFGWPLG